MININDSSAPMRRILFGMDNDNNKIFHSNYIKTTKYTPLTFIPKSLYQQFQNYANIYFLIVAIIQSIPIISPLNPVSSVVPLLFVIFVSMIKEAFEDFNRYKSDLIINSDKTHIIKNDKIIETLWKDIKVGDIVKVNNKEFFPADLLLIHTSNDNELCYIQTSSLDGEKNLKPKNAISEINRNVSDNYAYLMGNINCTQPNQYLNDFDGNINIYDTSIIFTSKNLLYRGANLMNTEFVYGIVVYTGFDTKIMQNSQGSVYKKSNIERISNKLILFIIVGQVILSVIAMGAAFIWNFNYFDVYNRYYEVQYGYKFESFLLFFTIFILLTPMIPISLIISLEMVKLMQAFFMNKDFTMYNEEEKRFSKVMNSSLNEELGQVEYIFSDKTGTLTCNSMVFKNAVIGEQCFEFKEGATSNSKLDNYLKRKEFVNDYSPITVTNSEGEALTINDYNELCHLYLLTLSLCHNCIVDLESKNDLTASSFTTLKYQGESPDEIELVDVSKRMGYIYLESNNNYKLLNIFSERKKYRILNFFEFTSDRKRASVVFIYDNKILMLSKGADSIIIDRLSETQLFLENTNKYLLEFSKLGFRTLCFALKYISVSEYLKFYEAYKTCIENNNKEEAERLVSDLETGMFLIGCSCVEDKLQDGVKETIEDFLKASIIKRY